MWLHLTGINILNALYSTALIILTALVGLYHFRKANRAAQIEIVEDISKIAAYREEANEVLQERITQLGNELSDLKAQVAHLEGIKDYLLEGKIAWRRYAEALLRGERPPRPPE